VIVLCPKCHREVVAVEVPELKMVLFDSQEIILLIEGGTRTTYGCIPHCCERIEIPDAWKDKVRRQGPKVICEQCVNSVDPKFAIFNAKGFGWWCYKCLGKSTA